MGRTTWRDIRQALAQKNMLIATLMGFSAGVPILLTSRTLQAWFSYGGAANVIVGMLATVGLPYTFKFLWAPFLDRFTLPFLGRRRGWLLVVQVSLLLCIAVLSRTDPVANVQRTFIIAFLIAFLSATQDTLVDAYRRETLRDEEMGLGSSVYQMGYRVAMWLTGGFTFILADLTSWNAAYLMMSTLMVVGILTTFWSDEPTGISHAPKTIKEAIARPLSDFFSRRGAFLFLLFVLLYKVGDAMAGNMLTKFYVDMQYTAKEVGVIAKTMGPISGLAGAFVGGALILKWGIQRSLFGFGILQALSTLSFASLIYTGHSLFALGAVVFFEDFSAGMGSAAFMAFMAILTNRAFTATQFALLTSLMMVPRTVISSFTGFLVDSLGWQGFFIFCAAIAMPGLMLLIYMNSNKSIQFKASEPAA